MVRDLKKRSRRRRGGYNYPRLSPDGNKVALDILGPNRDIWMWDLHREELTRFTSDPAENLMPVWSLDSKMIAYGQRSDISKLFWQAAGGGSPELLNDGSVSRIPVAFTQVTKSSSSPRRLETSSHFRWTAVIV